MNDRFKRQSEDSVRRHDHLVNAPSTSTPTHPPDVIGDNNDQACPNCGCLPLYIVRVALWNKEMGDCWGTYDGCPACTYAGPMTVVQEKPEGSDDGS